MESALGSSASSTDGRSAAAAAAAALTFATAGSPLLLLLLLLEQIKNRLTATPPLQPLPRFPRRKRCERCRLYNDRRHRRAGFCAANCLAKAANFPPTMRPIRSIMSSSLGGTVNGVSS